MHAYGPNYDRHTLDAMARHPIAPDSFGAACLSDNDPADLIEALVLNEPDPTDCATWGITPAEWRAAIAAALYHKIAEMLDCAEHAAHEAP